MVLSLSVQTSSSQLCMTLSLYCLSHVRLQPAPAGHQPKGLSWPVQALPGLPGHPGPAGRPERPTSSKILKTGAPPLHRRRAQHPHPAPARHRAQACRRPPGTGPAYCHPPARSAARQRLASFCWCIVACALAFMAFAMTVSCGTGSGGSRGWLGRGAPPWLKVAGGRRGVLASSSVGL